MRNFLYAENVLFFYFFLMLAGILSFFFSPLSALIAQNSNEKDVCVYTTQRGDTLSRIASQFTGKLANYKQIMQFNALASDILAINQQLNLPKSLLLEQYQSCEFGSPSAISTPIPSPAPTPLPVSTPILSATPTPTVTPIPTLPPPRKKSEQRILPEITGIVFDDANGDRHLNPGEKGIPGIRVLLVKPSITQISDEQGKFVFAGVDPGEQAVCLDEIHLPDDYRLTTSAMVLISLVEGDRGYVEFGVRRIHEH